MEKRGGTLIDTDQATLEQRMRRYCDPNVTWETLAAAGGGLVENAARFDARKTRNKILAVEKFVPSHLRAYFVRPFDTRYCYYSGVRPLWNEPRPTLWAQCWPGNSFLLTRCTGKANPEGVPFCFTRLLGDDHALRDDAYYFPVRLRGALADMGLHHRRLSGHQEMA